MLLWLATCEGVVELGLAGTEITWDGGGGLGLAGT